MQSKQYFTKIKNYPHEKSTEPMNSLWMNLIFTLMSLPSSSSTEMMPVSTKSVHGVKSVINLGLVWMYSLKNTAFINSLFYRIG